MGQIRLVRPNGGDIRTEDDIRSGVSHPSSVDMPTDEQVLDTVVANNGIVARASAFLDISEEYIYGVVSRNARLLSTKLRARLMLDTFTTLVRVDAVLQHALEDMSPGDVGKTYAATLGAFTNLAGQFEETGEVAETDDADAAKDWIVSRLSSVEKREQLNQAQASDAV